MSWFKRGPSVSDRLDKLEATVDGQQRAIAVMLGSIETLVRALDDLIDAHAASSIDDIKVSIALTKRLFDLEKDMDTMLDIVGSLGFDVASIKSMHTELITALKAREVASSESLDLPTSAPEPDHGPN